MTRGLRSRVLREPEPDPPVAYETGASEVVDAGRNELGRWKPGHVGINGPHKHSRSIVDALRNAFSPEQIVEEYRYHVFTKHSETALISLVDRVAGRPVQALEVSRSEDDPAVVEARRLADQWAIILGMTSPPTLIEAPISQDTDATK